MTNQNSVGTADQNAAFCNLISIETEKHWRKWLKTSDHLTSLACSLGAPPGSVGSTLCYFSISINSPALFTVVHEIHSSP
jgi:hypothetical protein